ncbi:MAG: hypothetical protein NUV80_02955 [Candidatus Berkelbacteria bacterium]|nr:hypothetical protein [Candidatus Berkelbacteria bacterium]MCR4307493.1 hypothetical protein [Candidatus Berkelbacteria bacterium]
MVKTKKKAVKHQPEKLAKKESRISFETPEFPHHTKNELWYIGIGILLLVGLFASISTKNYLFALVVVAAGIAIFRLAHLKPGSRKVEITPRGVMWGDQFWGYHQLKNFWVSEASGDLTVYLERPNLKPMLHFTVPDHQVESVLLALSLELPFHSHKNEPIPDRFARLLRI